MPATTRFAAAFATLSVLLLPPVYASPRPLATSTSTSTTSTPSTSATVTTVSSASVTAASSSLTVTQTTCAASNPNGPYCNVNDFVALPFTWPGKPTKGQTAPPPKPTPKWNYGGGNATYQAPAWVPKGKSLIPALSQSVTNGKSLLGTLGNLPLLPYLGLGSLAKPCDKMPNTGVTRYYNFAVSYQQIAPDGVQKNGLVINGAFPGPLIEANWGDWIQITVTNNLPDEGTSLHWHGFLQSATPWFDGVPSVSQCPIAPGASLVYKFRADMYGTTWYHSHYSAQYAGGALGPIVVHGPKTAAYDIDLGPIILSDWYHQDYFTLVNETMNGGVPASDNNLINGKMNYPCANTTFACTPNAGISKFTFIPGKKYRLRLINTSAEGIQKFTIDGHTFTVIANDFIPINPYTTNVITLGVGQRSDVIVEAVGKAGDAYWMRSDLGTFQKGCSFTSTVSPQALAAVYYLGANTNSLPTTNTTLTDAQLTDCGNDPLSKTTAYCALTPAPVANTTEEIDIVFGSNGTNFVWFMDGSSFHGDYNDPLLGAVKAGNLTFEPEWNVHNFGTNGTIRLVIKNTFPFSAHPMHLHGHNFHVLAEGFGDWDGTVTNPNNTQMRDVQLVRSAQDFSTPAYIVLQWTNDNPGVWPLHCHIAWHVSAGLYINVLENPAGIQARNFDTSLVDTCKTWGAWTGNHIPDQIDSGL